jgi:hypothetical protein
MERVLVSPETLKQRLPWWGALGSMHHVRAVAQLAKGEALVAVAATRWQGHFWFAVATNAGLRLARDPRLFGCPGQHAFDWDDLTAIWFDSKRGILTFGEVDVDIFGGSPDELARLAAEARAHIDQGMGTSVDDIRQMRDQLGPFLGNLSKSTFEGLAYRLAPGERVELLAAARLDFNGLLVLTDRRLLLLDDDQLRKKKRRQWAIDRSDVRAAGPVAEGLRLFLEQGTEDLVYVLPSEQREKLLAALNAPEQSDA